MVRTETGRAAGAKNAGAGAAFWAGANAARRTQSAVDRLRVGTADCLDPGGCSKSSGAGATVPGAPQEIANKEEGGADAALNMNKGELDGFWLERWEANRIQFHRSEVHPTLVDFAKDMGEGPVFVPLAGKTVDLRWLAERGHKVVAVELVELAVRAFFEEQGLTFDVSSAGRLQRFDAREFGITFYQGDVFDLTPEHLKDVAWVHDRAALVALPAQTRARYATHLATILPPTAEVLITTFEYEQERMDGPPFSVPPTELTRIYEAFSFSHLRSRALEGLGGSDGGEFREHVCRGRRT